MRRENLVIDGCAFTEAGVGFVGVTDQVLKSDVDAFFLTIPSENSGYTACTKAIGGIYNLLDNDKKGLKIARSVNDIYAAKEKGLKSIVLAFQNPNPIENSLDQLRVFYELGVRVIQITYNNAGFTGCGCSESVDSGLTDFGKIFLARLNELGILPDASHCGPKTTMDVIKYSKTPVAITHAGAYSITPSVRTKTDEMLYALKENAGVIGISPWGPLCWKKDNGCRPDVKDFVDHIDYVRNLIGMDYISFGCDNTLDGSLDEAGTVEQATLFSKVVGEYNAAVGTKGDERHAKGFSGCWELENVRKEMRARGYSEEDIAKFTGGNLLRVINANWK